MKAGDGRHLGVIDRVWCRVPSRSGAAVLAFFVGTRLNSVASKRSQDRAVITHWQASVHGRLVGCRGVRVPYVDSIGLLAVFACERGIESEPRTAAYISVR